uniref:F-box domain-containing protein n=1 Tax=Panagrellus redivivus TaxID=6233 RepID=A0A7E4V5X5_PANRE
MDHSLKRHLYDEIVPYLGLCADPASTMINFALTGKQPFAAVDSFIRDNVDACFDKYEVEFLCEGILLDLKRHASFFANRAQKFVMKFPVIEWHIEHEEEAKLDCEAMKVLDNNHVIDTAEFGTEYNDIPDFLNAFLARWPTVKTLRCRAKLLIVAMRNDAAMLSKFETLGLFWDFVDLCQLLKVFPLLPTLKHLEIDLKGTPNDLLKRVFAPMPSVETIKLSPDVDAISGSYFNELATFLKNFPNLKHADVKVQNTKLCPKDNVMAKVTELRASFKEANFDSTVRFHLIEDYDNSTNAHEDQGGQVAPGGDPFAAFFQQYCRTSDSVPDEIATKLIADGFESVSLTDYRRVWKYLGKTFIHDVCFKNKFEFNMSNMARILS